MYRFTKDRSAVVITEGDETRIIPWTDDPVREPETAGNAQFRELYKQYMDKKVKIDEPLPDIPPSARDMRAIAYRDELGKEQGDFVKTLGDVVDVLIFEVEALRKGEPKTANFNTLVAKVDSIKKRFPEK